MELKLWIWPKNLCTSKLKLKEKSEQWLTGRATPSHMCVCKFDSSYHIKEKTTDDGVVLCALFSHLRDRKEEGRN